MGVLSKSPVLVELYYDIISPYSWLGFEVLCRYKNIWNMDLKLKPFLLGGIMKSSGNKPPAMVPNKAVYMHADLNKLTSFYQVPLTVPENFMDIILSGKGSLYAQRFLTAVDMKDPALTENLSRALYERLFKEHKDISEAESFVEAAKKAGISESIIQMALDSMNDDTVKNRLKVYTQEALDRQSFGAPSIVVHIPGEKPHLFFGCDRMELMAHCIGEKWMSPCPANYKSNL